MDLGGLTEFRYVPKFRGNRDQPEEEQVSVMVKRLSAIDVLQELTEDQLFSWRDEAFHDWAITEKEGDEETVKGFQGIAEGLDLLPASMLLAFRKVVQHTHGYRNITHGDRTITKAQEIFLLARIPDTFEQEGNLLVELLAVLRETAALTDDELKNYQMPSDGGAIQINTSATGAVEGTPQTVVTGKAAKTGS